MSNQSNQQLATVQTNLEKLLNDHVRALPKDFNQTRFLQNCLTVLKDVKNIEKCEYNSILTTLLKGAFLGLDFLNGECYAIPYMNTEKNVLELNFQTDYKGERKLARMYSIKPIKDIYSKVVRKGDVITGRVVEGKQVIDFDPIPFNDAELIGVFSVIIFEDGIIAWNMMSKKEVDETRKNWSKYPDSKAWKYSYPEMAKKTSMRQELKLVEMRFDNPEQEQAWVDGGDLNTKEITDTIDVPGTVRNPLSDNKLPAKSPSQYKTDDEGKIIE